MKLPDKKYRIIYADPPWAYRSFEKMEMRGLAKNHYSTMSIEQIMDLPVCDIADNDCMLFLWATFPSIDMALKVIESWGFVYKTAGFVWIKTDKNSQKPKTGMGWYTKSNAEVVLIGRKGSFTKQHDNVCQVIISTASDHSKKPDEVRKRIIKLCGDLPRIELFARTQIHGWDTWGNDTRLTELQPLENFTNEKNIEQ